MDKISIIVPIYNIDRYLKICLDSILNQSYTELEIILIMMDRQTILRRYAIGMQVKIIELLFYIKKMKDWSRLEKMG